ncbi:hypothetical protein BDF20DRAFT_885905 [Mycotypha africana]|uniref:uncharacterized protein n=1 Tax=Mycotypha africana TaxID=64632 RepID=UPI0023017AC5|nr:uncharacterized protein BDF20DRAFT_885905 [Mycotypha africana]KAI8971699.1 hypothetical protein BDF20DRAFT_885905 [Mycotypha africana]
MSSSKRTLDADLPTQKKRKRSIKAALTHNLKDIQTKRFDFVANIFSKELVLKVFSYLSPRDLRQCAAVSYRWSVMANDEMLWKPLFYKRFHTPRIKYRIPQTDLLKDNYHLNSQRRAETVSKYRGSWKLKYKVHRNWLLGHCQISDIIFQAVNQNNSSHFRHVQVYNNMLLTNRNNSPTVEVWKYMAHINGSTATLVYQFKADDIKDNTRITQFKLFTQQEVKKKILVAGYSNGGFTLWEIANKGAGCEDLSKENIIELFTYVKSVCGRTNNDVSAVSLEYPILTVHAYDTISIYHIESATVKLIRQFRCPYDWKSVALNVFPCKTVFGNRPNNLWKIVICFVIAAGNSYPATVGIQELLVSENDIVSSKQSLDVQSYPLSTDFAYSLLPTNRTSFTMVTSIAYSPPHLITAYDNNTIEKYMVTPTSPSSEISRLHIHKQNILYGHTYKVEAIAIDALRQKLISADRSCIKIWNLHDSLLKQSALVPSDIPVTIPIFDNLSAMMELPFCKVEKLDFNEDKIVAIIGSPLEDTSSIRLWSFHT